MESFMNRMFFVIEMYVDHLIEEHWSMFGAIRRDIVIYYILQFVPVSIRMMEAAKHKINNDNFRLSLYSLIAADSVRIRHFLLKLFIDMLNNKMLSTYFATVNKVGKAFTIQQSNFIKSTLLDGQ